MAHEGGESFRVIDRRRVRPEGEESPEPAVAPQPGEEGAPEPAATPPPDGGRAASPLPSPTFPTLVQMLAVNALGALGAAPDAEGEGGGEPDLPLARHCVDLLGMLEEKCRGNLSEPERRFLEQTLFDLRMLVVRAASRPRS